MPGGIGPTVGVLDLRFDPLIPSAPQTSDWPLSIPTDSQIEKWKKAEGAVHYVARSCLHDDFNHYTIHCLDAWKHQMGKPAIGAWILNHVVEAFGLDGEDCDSYDKYTAQAGGGGRSKPAWAERIGKKYQWVALYRLASRLHDNAPREESSWEPRPERTPLILVDERKLDPTLSHTVVPEKAPSECWWMRGTVNLAATKDLDFASWVAKRDDLPRLETLLQPTTHLGQRWVVLTAYPTWSEYRSEAGYDTPYRLAWLHLRSYLVPKSQFQKTIRALDGRNYFGRWRPEPGKWLHAFAGEYPSATACNTEPDWYLGAGGNVRGSSLELTHSANEIVIEWEYDATLPVGIHLEVPTKKFFVPGDLWWNGTDGYSTIGGKTVFCDPRVVGGGPTALLADINDLLPRLDKMGSRLVWTLLGEKSIVDDKRNQTPPLYYSQMAVLNKDGVVTVRKRSFFKSGEHQGLRND